MVLKDTFGRIHDYLRFSITDKCNLRCLYCIPEDVCFMQNDQMLSKEEILKIASVFVHDFGIKKIRLTGGEPLVRHDAREIVEGLSKLPVSLAITSNGVLLDDYIHFFKRIGLKSINISMDTLKKDRFKQITRKPAVNIKTVKKNIELYLKNRFSIKVNVVVMKNINEDEILDFVGLTQNWPLHIRFIEFMPFKGNQWRPDGVVSYKDIMERIHGVYSIEKLHDKPNSTSKSYRVKGYNGTFSVISSVTAPFCDSCNRLRITADGKFRNCLFAKNELDLITPLRQKKDIKPFIENTVRQKSYVHGGINMYRKNKHFSEEWSNRPMLQIGG